MFMYKEKLALKNIMVDIIQNQTRPVHLYVCVCVNVCRKKKQLWEFNSIESKKANLRYLTIFSSCSEISE